MAQLDGPVFWAEGDDDAPRLLSTPYLPQLSLAAYLLLGRRVVIHPAYVWQSESAHRLILRDNNGTIIPGNTDFVLGDSASISDYINNRLSRLSGTPATQASETELQQYQRHGRQLWLDARHLDEKFTREGGTYPLTWSRDERYRTLVREDLANDAPFGPHLRAAIIRFAPAATRAVLIGRLEAMTHNRRRLVSVDSVKRIAVRNGFPEKLVGALDSRLHVLHWYAQHGDGVNVPMLSRLDQSQLHHDDPFVFWRVVNNMLGPTLQTAVCVGDWDKTCEVISELRRDPLWQDFVTAYRHLVAIVNGSTEELAATSITARLHEKYPGHVRLIRTAQISKLGWLSVICTLLGLSSGMGVIALGGTIGTLGDAFFAVLRRYQEEWSGGRPALKSRVLRLLKGQVT